MSNIPKEKRDKILAVAMCVVMVVGAIWFFVIRAQTRTLEEVRKQKQADEQRVAQGQTTLKATESVDQAYKAVQSKLKTCENEMASPADMFSWLTQTLNTFRLGHDIEIPQFSRETPAEVGIFAKFPYAVASFTVRGSGSYHDFGKFLAAFENAFPYIRVQDIDLTPSGDVGSTGKSEKLTFKMDLLTLVRPTSP
jgi:Tfp pilus assembly protein PilO